MGHQIFISIETVEGQRGNGNMKNTLMDLNNYLFEEIERLQDDELTEDMLDREIRRAEAVRKTADVIIQNASLTLKAYTTAKDFGDTTETPQITMFGNGSVS